MKKCCKCKQLKPLGFFGKNKSEEDGVCRECNDCRITTRKVWYNKDGLNNNRRYRKLNPDAEKKSYLKIKYGITIEYYNNLIIEQKNKCAGCGVSFLNTSKHLDHCHKTGNVRGFLCKSCNWALGNVKDNISTLENLIKYLAP